jgi:hypothetical protein
MSVYKRGTKGVFYMNFTVEGVRVFQTTGKYTKREAKQVEALERQKLLNKASMTPQEKAASMLFGLSVKLKSPRLLHFYGKLFIARGGIFTMTSVIWWKSWLILECVCQKF